MSLNYKKGKGGYGYEFYDSDGKYVGDMAFTTSDGETISNFDDFVKYGLKQIAIQSNGEYTYESLLDFYNQNQEFKEEIDANFGPEYENFVSKEVDRYNATQVFSSPKEAAEKLHEIFVPSLVQNLLENNILTSDASEITREYSVDTFAACVQMSRYKKNRANVITSEEYNVLFGRNMVQMRSLNNSTEAREYRDYIEEARENEWYIPISRNISVYRDSGKEILRSFYDENSPRLSCLATADARNCSYLGSVIYFSGDHYSYGGSNLCVRGVVKLDKNVKLLECPLSWGRASEYTCNREIPEINQFRNTIRENEAEFDKKMLEKIMDGGNLSKEDANIILGKLKNKINYDPGFCAMLMGYDAIYGVSYHFDILNLGICDLIGE